jgi:D-tyrosyl-tRNA(Tyr) deacylase
MKAVVQRVKRAGVSVDGKVSGSINAGLLVYLGVSQNDTDKDADWLADKIIHLRIFGDEQGKMNVSLNDVIARGADAGVLAISQFTLLGDCIKGRRPFYGEAAGPQEARLLYERFIDRIRGTGIVCEAGVFQAHMEVMSVNDGPVTILLDSSITAAAAGPC